MWFSNVFVVTIAFDRWRVLPPKVTDSYSSSSWPNNVLNVVWYIVLKNRFDRWIVWSFPMFSGFVDENSWKYRPFSDSQVLTNIDGKHGGSLFLYWKIIALVEFYLFLGIWPPFVFFVVIISAIHTDFDGGRGQGLSFFHLHVHLRRCTSHRNDFHRPDPPPAGAGTAVTCPRSTSSLSTTFLCALRIWCAQTNTTTWAAHAAAYHTELRCKSWKEADTIVYSILEWIISEVPFLFNHSTIDVVRAADAPGTSQAADLGRQEGMRTLTLAVCSTLDRKGCSRTSPRKADRTVVVSLPEFVFGHVTTEQLFSHIPLPTRCAGCVKAALERDPDRSRDHGKLPASSGGICFGSAVEAKDKWEGQRASEAPYDIGNILHAWVNRLEAIGNNSQTTIAAASFSPAVAAIFAHAILSSFHVGVSFVNEEEDWSSTSSSSSSSTAKREESSKWLYCSKSSSTGDNPHKYENTML